MNATNKIEQFPMVIIVYLCPFITNFIVILDTFGCLFLLQTKFISEMNQLQITIGKRNFFWLHY